MRAVVPQPSCDTWGLGGGVWAVGGKVGVRNSEHQNAEYWDFWQQRIFGAHFSQCQSESHESVEGNWEGTHTRQLAVTGERCVSWVCPHVPRHVPRPPRASARLSRLARGSVS